MTALAKRPPYVFGAKTRTYYNPGNTIPCPDCSKAADADFGDHGGECIDTAAVAVPGTALGIIHRHALRNRRFSAEDIRALMDEQGIKPSSRGPAFGKAKRERWIEQDGFKESTGQSAKGAWLQTYTSLIYRPGGTN